MPKNSYCYELMTWDDLPAVADIESHVHAHPWTLGMFQDCFKPASQGLGYQGYVLKDDQEKNSIAYLLIQNISEQDHLLTQILTMGVSQIYQRQGCASYLFQQLFLENITPRRYLLEVSEFNIAAIELYKKQGFSAISVRKHYYGSVNAIVLQYDPHLAKKVL